MTTQELITPLEATALRFYNRTHRSASGYAVVWDRQLHGRIVYKAAYGQAIIRRVLQLDAAGSQEPLIKAGIFAEKPAPGKAGTAREVSECSVLWVDLDIARSAEEAAAKGHTYAPSQEDALGCLAGLPAPSYILHTGRGLLAVWCLDKAYPTADGRLLAALRGVQAHTRTIAAASGWEIDKTALLTFGLRLPGTHNRKGGAEVRILSETPSEYSLIEFEGFVPLGERARRAPVVEGEGLEGSVSPEKLSEMLRCIDPDFPTLDGAERRKPWISILWLITQILEADAALEVCAEWTEATDEKGNDILPYTLENLREQDYGEVGIGTLVHWARQGGWRGVLTAPAGYEADLPCHPFEAGDEIEGGSDDELFELADMAQMRGCLPEGRRCLLFKAPMGSGKTQWLSKVGIPREASLLVISPRISLVESNAREYGCVSYAAGDYAAPRLAITVDSLWKLPSDARYEYIVLDESEQILVHLGDSNTLAGGSGRESRRGACHNRLVALLETVREEGGYVVMADADCGRLSYQFALKHLGREALAVWINTHKPARGTVYAHTSKPTIDAKVFEAIDAGKKVYICANTKEDPKALEVMIAKDRPGTRVLTIHGENSTGPAALEFLKDVNAGARKLDVLIGSPSISTGISITAHHFDVAFLYAPYSHTTYQNCLQQLGRVRNLADRTVHCLAATRPVRFLEGDTRDERRDWVIEMRNATNELLSEIAGRPHSYEINGDLLELWLDVKDARHRSSHRFAPLLYGALEAAGWSVEPAEAISEEARKHRSSARAAAVAAIKEEDAVRIRAARKVDSAEYSRLKKANGLSLEDRAARAQYRLIAVYNLEGPEAITLSLLKRDARGLASKRYELAYIQNQAFALAVDRKEAAEGREAFDGHHFAARAALRRGLLESVDLTAGPLIVSGPVS